jgi:hypothetical protein
MSESDEALQASAARIERLLDEVHAVSGPAAWERVELLVSALVNLHGSGFKALLDHALAMEDRTSFLDHIADDPLVSGLLVLHGTHPLEADARVERVLARLRPALAEQGLTLEIVEIGEHTAKFRAGGADVVSHASTLRRAAALAADQVGAELGRVEVLGLPPDPDGLIGPERLLREVTR